MIQLYYTYRIYKKFSNPVLGRRKLNQAGFFNLKITTEEVIDSLSGGLKSAIKVSETLFDPCENYVWTVEESGLVANNLVHDEQKDCSLLGSPFILSKIKGRVERDCLNVSENKTEILSNTYSAKALCWAPTSEDSSCMMRVIKETGSEKCGRPENEGRPIKVRNNDSKSTLKFNLYRLFSAFQL